MATTGNPWKGLKSYTEGEILYGRNDDIQALSQYIINNTQTVLYGKSGIGKSSILNAGVFPVARQNGLFPIPIRLEHNSTLSYVQQLAAATTASGLEAHEVVPVIDKSQESLWEFIHRQYFTLKNDDTPVQPLFVIDQFEEIFSLQSNEKKKLIFFSQLADLLNDVCPMYIHEKINNEIVDEASTSKVDLNEVVSLDSFTFNLGDEISSGENQPEYLDCPSYHIVFAMREDFLSYLERYTSYIPVMKNNRFGLKPLNEEQAAEIIMKPCPGLVDIDVAVHIIQKVTGRNDFTLDGIPEIDVDSAVLSLYLSRLYEKKAPHADKLTNELIDEFGENIIKDFYLESIADLSPETVENLEYQLLTSDGRRDNVSRSDLESSGVSAEQIDTLINDKKILRQFSYGNDIRIEYIHDILCPVITKLKEEKELEKLKQQQKSAEDFRHQENRRKNQQRVQNDLNVLTVRGRKPLDNTLDFGAFENSNVLSKSGCPQDVFIVQVDSLLDFNFRYLHHDEVNVSSIGRLVDAGEGNVYTTCIEFKDQDGISIRTIDGISKMNVMFDGNLITQIEFIKSEKNYQGLIEEKPFYIKGFCGIKLSYDNLGREIRRTYLDEEQHPVSIFGGYAIVEHRYDSIGNLVEVKYFDAENKPTCHWNGNHGFSSEFDEDGLEVRRLFFDIDMKITRVTSGICGRAFEYDAAGRIIYEANLDAEKRISRDNKGYCAVQFEYNEMSLLARETYLDEKRKPMIADKGFAITVTTYDNNALKELYFDENGKPITDNDGIDVVIERFNQQYRPISISYIYHEDNNKSRTGVIGGLQFKWDEDGLLQNIKRFDLNGSSHDAFWVLYDKRNLFVLTSGCMDEKGQKKAGDDGFYGTMYERDDRGFVCRLFNIDMYNQAAPSSDGVFFWRILELEDGNIKKCLWYDMSNRPVANEKGTFGFALEFDTKGNVTAIIRLDEYGNPSPDNDGVQTTRMAYNDNDAKIAERYYDSKDNNCVDQYGNYGKRFEKNQESRLESEICIGENGKPHNDINGVCYYNTYFDDKSREVLKEYLDKDRKKVPKFDDCYALQTIYNDEENSKYENYIGKDGDLVNDSNGIASTYSKYDELGRLILQKCYDRDDSLVIDEKGDSGTAYEYSEDGREIKVISLDESGQIHVNKYGYAICRTLFDDQGREIEDYYYDVNGEPTKYDNDFYGSRIIYTDQDNKYIYMALDQEGAPLFSSSYGYYAIEKEIDNKGRTIHQRYLDSNLQPLADPNGSYGAHWSFNDEDNSMEVSWLIDIDDKVKAMDNGIAYEFQMNDEDGRIVFECYYDINHQLIKDDNGVFGTKCTYLEDGAQLIEYLDEEQNPMLSNQGYGAIYRGFDEQKRQTLEMWLGLDGKPSPNESGVSGWTKEFLDDGRILITNLDAEQNPVPDEDGEISTLITLDEEDREISKICLDVDLNPCPCNDGWIRRDKKYDEQGNEVECLFYDAEGNPMADKYGDYGLRLLPVEDPNEEWLAFLGSDGKPHINQHGFASRYRLYDEQRRIIKEINYDKRGIAVKDDVGAYGHMHQYQDDGTQLWFFLDEEGEPMITQDGVKYEMWKFDEKGRVILYRQFDEYDQPIPNSGNDHGIMYVFNDESHTKEAIGLNEDGKPHNNRFGWASHVIHYDELDREILNYKKTIEDEFFIDEDGSCITKTKYDDEHPGHYYVMNVDKEDHIIPLREGQAYTEIYDDEQGRRLKQFWCDDKGDLCPDENGVCGQLFKYMTDESGQEVKLRADYNSKKEIITDEFGRTYYQETDDENGNKEQRLWLNANMEPVPSGSGDYGFRYEYPYGRHDGAPYVIICLDKDYKPHNNTDGYGQILVVKDARGDEQFHFLDIDGNFVDVDHDD